MEKKFKIAIDGPVGVGKGTLASALAQKFNALYINTGAMYRALTLACLRKKIDTNDKYAVLKVLGENKIDLRIDGFINRVFLNGEEISEDIFLPEVSNSVSIVSTHPDVRREMVKRQKELAETKDRVIIEGRDIATEVAPDADLKIYLTADIKIRAQRRYRQMQKNKIDSSYYDVLLKTEKRDKTDIEREASPLIITKDSYVLDTTNLTIEETVDKVVKKLSEKGIT